MSELRRDPILGQWIIVQSEDSWSPQEYEAEEHVIRQESVCQFCEGREHLTPPEVAVKRKEGTGANQPGWQTRVVPNKFPALKIEGRLEKKQENIYQQANGIGAHEVVIETPKHLTNIADFFVEEIVEVLHKYQGRLIELTKDKRFKYISIFKNYGESAGTSVEHAHSQIIALPMIPKYVLEEMEGTRKYYAENKRCIYCDMIKQEEKDKERIVVDAKDFIAFCPYVPRYAFETWIIPKKHISEFELITDKEKYNLAAVLKEVLTRIKKCLKDPSYNYYLHIAPINYEGRESFHWHIEIVPNLKQVSGFEWGTGFSVVRTRPSEAAKYLRNIKYPSKK